jgi:hypothetical protein
MKTLLATLATLSICTAPVLAQSPRQASFMGAVWGFHLYETGAAMVTTLTGRPSLHDGQPDAVITVVSRDGRPLTEADRDAAARLARGLCEQTGRRFNTQTRGHWLANGGLGFQGACTQW